MLYIHFSRYKKIVPQVFVLIVSLIATIMPLHSFDSIDFSQLNNTLPTSNTAEADPDYVREVSCAFNDQVPNCLSPETILFLVTDGPVKLQNLLQFDVYNRTNPLMTRSLHTYPSLGALIQEPPINCLAFTFKPFFIYMPKGRFTKDSSALSSYSSMLTNHDWIEAIDLDDFPALDIPEVLPLFGKMTIEQRQLGAMLFAQGQSDNWIVTIALPILYLENNYQLSEADKRAIENSALFSGYGVPTASPVLTPSRDFSTFTEDHLISDKAGIGDLRCEAWYRAGSGKNGTCDVGAQVTIPTAHAITTGIFGARQGTFDKTAPIPFFDIQTLFNLYTCEPKQYIPLSELVVDLGIAALDRLSANVLDTPMGQQHASIGPVFRAVGCTNDGVAALQVTGEVSYLVPQDEVRFFKVKKDLASFNRDYTDPDTAQKNLNFLSSQATNTLYPTAVKIKVHPGFIVNITAAALITAEHFSATAGFNMWGKTRESFGCINCRYPVCDPQRNDYGGISRYTSDQPLDFDAGKLTGGYQGRLFGMVSGLIRSHPTFDVRVGLRGDGTIFTSAIGYDFTLAVDFIIDF